MHVRQFCHRHPFERSGCDKDCKASESRRQSASGKERQRGQRYEAVESEGAQQRQTRQTLLLLLMLRVASERAPGTEAAAAGACKPKVAPGQQAPAAAMPTPYGRAHRCSLKIALEGAQWRHESRGRDV